MKSQTKITSANDKYYIIHFLYNHKFVHKMIFTLEEFHDIIDKMQNTAFKNIKTPTQFISRKLQILLQALNIQRAETTSSGVNVQCQPLCSAQADRRRYVTRVMRQGRREADRVSALLGPGRHLGHGRGDDRRRASTARKAAPIEGVVARAETAAVRATPTDSLLVRGRRKHWERLLFVR